MSVALAPRLTLVDKLRRGDEILDVPKAQTLVGGILQTNSLAALYGPPGSGKSFVALDLALSVATGRRWLDQDVIDGPVLYIVAEDVPGIAQRVRAWRARHGSLGAVAWLLEAVQILAPGTLDQLVDVAAELAPALIVFDTLARCTVGLDENSAQDMGRLVQALDLLRERTGACILLIHHSGKDTSRGLRGSSALLGALDTTIECARTLSGVTTRVTKAKNGPADTTVRFRLDPEGDSVVLVETEQADNSDGFRPTALMEKVSRFLAEAPEPISRREIERQVPGRAEFVRLAITRLVDEGYVTATPGPRGSLLHRSVRPFDQDGGDPA
jgi:hypothetical protein